MAAGLGEVAERLRRATVQVRASPRAAGSGLIVPGPAVVTNAHVATTASPRIELWDGRQYTARLLARDPRCDLAVLDIGAPGLEPAVLAGSPGPRPGAVVIAVGNPLGFAGALTRGVVHAVGPVPGLGRRSWVQAAVQPAPGNSGGPLADAAGLVVGINTMVWRGLGLAIPSPAVSDFLLRGAPPAVQLGVTLQPVSWNGTLALLVLEVRPGSAAESASLLPGDLLVGADGARFTSPACLATHLESAGPLLHLQYVRGDRTTVRSVAVRLPPPRMAAA